MARVELSNAQKEFLSMCDKFQVVRGQSNVWRMFGGKANAKTEIKDLEDKGIIQREAYGKWSLTEKGSSFAVGEVGCDSCGRSFDSIEDARYTDNMYCDHNCLSSSLRNFE